MSQVQVKRRKIEQWGGIEVSRLGFGIMRMPIGEDKKMDRAKASAMLHKAIASGVNYFDSAYLYHGGESELFLGEELKRYPRESYYLATKLPTFTVDTEEKFYSIFNEQLAKLQTDYIDFYLLHGMSGARLPNVKKLGIVEKLVQLKKEGKIRRMGFSYHGDQASFDELIDMGVWDFAQIQINYLDNQIIVARGLYDKLVKANVPCVCMEPVRGGFLADPPEDVKTMMAGFEGGSVSPAGWGFRWCMDKDNMAVILSGMSTMEQVEENLATFSEDHKITPAQEEMLASAVKIINDIRAIPCTGCRYCMECPSGVDIPEIFRIYNHFKLFKNGFRASEEYSALRRNEHSVDQCTRCDACTPLCPQEMSVPDKLVEAKELLENAMQPRPR